MTRKDVDYQLTELPVPEDDGLEGKRSGHDEAVLARFGKTQQLDVCSSTLLLRNVTDCSFLSANLNSFQSLDSHVH